MRTTIEMKPEHRAKLIEIATRRGEKGFSSVIAEAIDTYLRSAAENEELRHRALRLRGKLSAEEASRLDEEVRRLREFWR